MPTSNPAPCVPSNSWLWVPANLVYWLGSHLRPVLNSGMVTSSPAPPNTSPTIASLGLNGYHATRVE